MPITNADGYAYEPVPVVDGRPPYPPELVAKSRALLSATLELVGFIGAAKPLARAVAAKYPVHAERAKASADIIGTDPLDIITSNLCYDLLLGHAVMGCSTLALAGPGGPVLARNMDWFPVSLVARASCVVNEDFGTNAGFLGLIGAVTGQSRNGFALCLNAVSGGSDPDGYPMLLFLRHVLDTASNYRNAVQLVTSERLMSGGVITVVGTRNDERSIIERAPRRATVRTASGNEPLMATNHYRDLTDADDCPRYGHLAAHAGTVPAMELLTNRNVLQDITAQHVVMCPAARSVEMFVPSHLLAAGYRENLGLADLMGFFTN